MIDNFWYNPPMINFEEFKKMEIRIGTIIEAQRVEGSEKLLRLKVDVGSEQRQILAGIGKAYDPEALIGKQIPVVANLEPKTMMGFESQGMILAADGDGQPVLLHPDSQVPDGAQVR